MEAEKAVAAKIINDPCASFTPEEAEVLRAMAKMWLALLTLGRLASAIRHVLTWFGWVIALYLAFKSGMLDWWRNMPK